MIVGDRKPLEELLGRIGPYKKILLLGCNECVTVCAVGGEREVGVLAAELRLALGKDGKEMEIREQTLERQCDHEYIEQVRPFVDDYEAILSMACGAGVQYVAEKYSKPVIPAVNTTFLGVTNEQGYWTERCQGCGSCVLEETGGICPIARCAKSLLNGPCGGSSKGKCEIDRELDCAWQLIIDRLGALGLMDRYDEVISVKDWRPSREGGPRKRVREDLRL
ncbi:MAG: methylenetetrahydrofolate reductase C-terminal domain-containing protein [Smithellaceae bacterium]|nr:methylenetetrahydrofolate reductase C-terminal domain-containing protein [Smithellaceae bacterium]